jgi:hypothetical protein
MRRPARGPLSSAYGRARTGSVAILPVSTRSAALGSLVGGERHGGSGRRVAQGVSMLLTKMGRLGDPQETSSNAAT